MVNILYVTTRQWNPGDEFILAGVRNIVEELGIQPKTESIYNKSPEVTSLFESYNFWKQPYVKSAWSVIDFALNITHYDNSFKSNQDINFYDYVIFAGSPGWYGGRLKPLYKKLEHYQGKVLFLGIGIPNKALDLSEVEKKVLKRSTIICRNPELVDALVGMGIEAKFLPCPAILSAKTEKPHSDKLEKIGLVFVTKFSHRNQAISDERYKLQNLIYERVLNKYQGGVICHYTDEIDDAAARFGKDKIHFRYDAKDYITTNSYTQFDYIISTRVHGNGLSSSLAIPNAAIAHDKRGGTVDGFKSEKINEQTDIIAFLEEREERLEQISTELIAHKDHVMEQYKSLLEPIFGKKTEKTSDEGLKQAS